MKRSLVYIPALMFLLFPAYVRAEERFDLRDATVRKYDGDLEIYLAIDATHLPVLKRNEQVSLEFYLEGAGQTLELPPVVYTGIRRYRYAERTARLSGGYEILPYRIYREGDGRETGLLEYRVRVPYSEWMERANLEYREIHRDVHGEETGSGGVLIADLFPPPPPWSPDPQVYQAMVFFAVPEAEEAKRRQAETVVFPEYRSNNTEIRSGYGNNAEELEKMNVFLQATAGDKLKVVDSLYLDFYGSPEGAYRTNERLMDRRSARVEKQITGRYGNLKERITVSGEPEDWNGLQEAFAGEGNDTLVSRDALAVIFDPDLDPDAKERILKYITRGEDWKTMQDTLFPPLRRIEIKVDYTIPDLDDRQLRELIFSRPEYLSHEEMYRTAFLFGKGSRDFTRAFGTAAECFPEEWESLNNVAGAYLLEGDTERALPILYRLSDVSEAYINLGVYYYILGDPERAESCFLKAREAAAEQAENNIIRMQDSFRK